MPIDAATTVDQPRGGRLHARQGRHRPDRDARRRGAPTSPTPTTWSRRSPGSSATSKVPSVLPTAPAGRGLTRGQRLRRRVGRTLAGAGCVEVHQLPVRRGRRVRRPRAARGRRAPAHRPAGEPALARGAVVHHDAAARPDQGGRPQHRSRRARGVAVRDRHRRVPGRPRPGADLRRRLAAHRRRAREARARRSPTSRCTSRSCCPASASAPAGGATGRAGRLVRRDRPGPSARRRARRRGRGALRRPDALAPRPLRASSLVGDQELGHAGELHPRVCQAFGRAGRAAPPSRSTSTCCCGTRRRRAAGAGVLDVPAREGGRRPRRRRVGAGRPTSRPRCAKAPASCWSRSGCSTSTTATRSAQGRSRWRSRCASAPRTGP